MNFLTISAEEIGTSTFPGCFLLMLEHCSTLFICNKSKINYSMSQNVLNTELSKGLGIQIMPDKT